MYKNKLKNTNSNYNTNNSNIINLNNNNKSKNNNKNLHHFYSQTDYNFDINDNKFNNNYQNINKLNKSNLDIDNIDNSDNKEDESILSYEDVKDICIYYDMSDLKKDKHDYLFVLNDYKNFDKYKKNFYINYFFNDKEINNKIFLPTPKNFHKINVIKRESNKTNSNKKIIKTTPSTNDSNKESKKFFQNK